MTDTNSINVIPVPLAGGTMTGPLILNANPTSALGAVTKQYADAIAAGFFVKTACVAASTGALTTLYNNGAAGVGATLTNNGAQAAFATDGVSLSATNRVLIWKQANAFENGIYTVTTVGSGATNWVLTRATDYDTAAEILSGTLIPVNTGTLYAQSSFVETATVVTVGVDAVDFSQFTPSPNSYATVELDNITNVAISTPLKSSGDATVDFGTAVNRWKDIFASNIKTGTTIGNTTIISGRDVDGAVDTAFITVTAGNVPTCALSGSVTGATQGANDNSTKLATTAYVDTVANNSATKELDNLTVTAVNVNLNPAGDDGIDLGAGTNRWSEAFVTSLKAGTTAGDTLEISAYDTDGGTWAPFATLTSNATPSMVLASTTQSVTQAQSDNSTRIATTEYTDTAKDSRATKALDNLASVAINTALISDTDATDNLGSATKRWADVFAEELKTGTTIGNSVIISAHDVDGVADTPFITLTAGNTPTCVIASGVTGTTQAPADNSTKIATTAYADAAAGAGATKALNNLAAVAINTSLVSDTDITDSLGTQAIRWNNIYAANLQTGDTAADTLKIGAWDVDGAVISDFITLTANNTPTCVLASGVTGTTQAPSDNSTKLATTAYADAAGAGAGATKALDNLAAVAINTSLVSDTDVTDNLGSQAIRWNNIYSATLQTGDTAADTLKIGAWDVDGAVINNYITLTAGNTTSCVLASGVTATTQAADTNNTTLSTTAYTDTAKATRATKALDNLSAVAINTSLVSDTDVTDSLGTQAIRWNNIYAASLQTGDTAADTLKIGAWDVDGAAISDFITLTAGNTPTCVLASGVTGTTQAAADNSTKLATTAYADAAGAGAGATKALDNLASVAINTSLLSDTDNTDDLGSAAKRWKDVYPLTIKTGTTAADTFKIQARDVDGAVYTDMLVVTANNTPTMTATITGGTITGITDLVVADGGTGLSTFTTAYGTVCAGTTATSALQTVSPGTSGKPLVSAGNAALPAYGTLGVDGGGTGIATTTAYSVICAGTTATGAMQSLASVGSAGQVLASNGAGALPSMQTLSTLGGSLVYLGVGTAANSATVNFDNLCTSTYDVYLVTLENCVSVSLNTSLNARFGTGGTPTYQSTLYEGITQCQTSSATTITSVVGPTTSIKYCGTGTTTTAFSLSNSSTVATSGNFYFSNINDSSNNKASHGIMYGPGTASAGSANSGMSSAGFKWSSATVVTSIQFFVSTGNISTGTFRLYGIKNS